jgi:hypothetical protein
LKARLLVAALVFFLSLTGSGGALAASKHQQRTLPIRNLTDIHVGRTKTELKAQIAYSTYIVEHFKKPAFRWYLLPRHSTCWTVRSKQLRAMCNHARLRMHAHVWLLAKAQSIYTALFVPKVDPSLLDAFTCIHHYEGAWNDETGNGFHGGLQMDYAFETRYGAEFYSRWGDAGHWPPWAQIQAAIRAHDSGRGFGPWPNTARYCGLL